MADFGDRDVYSDGVDHLVNGEPAEAVRLLAAAVRASGRIEARVALGKAHLERGDGVAAAETFSAILAGERAPGTGLRAYVHLLAARAAVARGLLRDAERHATEAERLDARFASASQRLRERVARAGV